MGELTLAGGPVLRTSHRRLRARRFARSPYAGADAPRHHPPCNFLVRIRNRNDGSPCFEGHIVVLQEKVRTRSAQNGSLPSSVDPRLPVPEATLFRNVRKLRSPISMPRTFNTSSQAQFATCTIHVLLMFVFCSHHAQSISSHGTLYSGVSNAHLCRKLAWGDWIILEAIASGLAVNAILTGMRVKERG